MFMTNYEMVYGKNSDGPVQRSYDTPVYPETDQSFYNTTQGLGVESNNKSFSEGINLLRNGFTNLSGKVMDYAHSDDAKNKLEKIKTLSGNALNNVRNISEKAVDYARSDEVKNKLENVKEFSGEAVNNIKNFSGAVIDEAKSGIASQLSNITPAEKKQNKINTYVEEDDDEYEDNDILKSPVTVIESDERRDSIVPILVAIIIMLGVGMILLLLSYRNLKMRSTVQMADNSNNAEYVTAVVSETQKAVEKNQEAESQSNNLNWASVSPASPSANNNNSNTSSGNNAGTTYTSANLEMYSEGFTGYVRTNGDVLNMRKGPGTTYEIIAEIPNGTDIIVYGYENGWYYIYYNLKYGFVSKDWLSLGEPPVTEKKSSYLGKGYVDTIDDDLNLRKSASTDSEVLTTIPKNTKLELYSADNSGWYYTSYNGKSGYVSADWVAFGEPPAVKPSTIYGLNPYLTGQISSGGRKIQGFTTDYVCYGGTKTIQWNCEDTWHITAKRRTSSYGVEWYECWDTDDGDYYGWIDSKFLSFYSTGSSSNNQGNSINPVTNINPYRTGEISSNGKKIEGYTTDYVCNGGAKTAQWICEDTWHITARRKTSSYGVEWYECWDTDDGDYYGWIDGKFLYFYR